MKKIILSIIVIILLSTISIAPINAFELNCKESQNIEHVVVNNAPFNGYTLLNPWLSRNTYLINNTGSVVHKWQSKYYGGLPAYLLENGSLIRGSVAYNKDLLRLLLGGGFSRTWDAWHGGLGGRVEMFDWDGNRIWNFEFINETHCLHNDIEVLPNGNILMTVWDYKTKDEAIAAGFDPNSKMLKDYGFALIDYIMEVEPTGQTSGNIVWEWHAWNHLIQDLDESKNNYGVVAGRPGLLDINYEGRPFDITHINSLEYIKEFDQILISARHNSEIWVIDHSTNTTEAAGHEGGNSSKGGDILYRWGNPQVYNRGDENDRKLFYQHDARWFTEPGFPDEVHITIFNNGYNRPEGEYSTVEEIIPPVDENGNYYLNPLVPSYPGPAYGPKETIWNYTADPPEDLFSIEMSGAQRLPNGNTFICSGNHGHLYEVTPSNEIVWEYINPYPYPAYLINSVFKTQCYPKDYPGISTLSFDNGIESLESEHVSIEAVSLSNIKQSTILNLFIEQQFSRFMLQ